MRFTFLEMNVKSSGRLIGMQVTPINLDEVVILNNMRNSQDGVNRIRHVYIIIKNYVNLFVKISSICFGVD